MRSLSKGSYSQYSADAEFNQAIEQGIGNATWVKLRADYVVVIAGTTRRVFDVTEQYGIFERELNILADLPKAYGKPQEYRFYKGYNQSDISVVTREELINTIKKCHQTLWGGGRLSPPAAFGELCKLIFVKISDEQKPRKYGEPYQFQIKTHEPSSRLAERINKLYDEQKEKDPAIFTESIKVDDRVLRTVVSHLESINLNKTDLDVKGIAFEKFMDSFFKGDFGQYFTPRPIIEFAVNMLRPQREWNVLDTSCGSGGFLLYALDFIRHQANEYYTKGTSEHYRYWHDFAEKHLFGIEINDEIARVAKMNMIVHDDGHTNVISFDALDSIEKISEHNNAFRKNGFDLILTNPPFGSTINLFEKPYLGNFMLGYAYDNKGNSKIRKTQSSEVLFIERIWEFLKPGTGQAAIVLPDGILSNSSSQYVRDFILKKFQILAVISLPQTAFAHFGAGVKASLLFVRKNMYDNENENRLGIFMAKPKLIGYDATGIRTSSQLDEIVTKYINYINGSVIVDHEETGYIVPYDIINHRIDVDHYSPQFTSLKAKIQNSIYPVVMLDDVILSIRTGFAAGKQDQADGLPDHERVPHLRPFSITSDGRISFQTKKYVPISSLNDDDYCDYGEVLFNNTNSAELVGKSAVFDVETKCAVSNHITRIVLKKKINPYYIAGFFNILREIGYWKCLCTNFNNQSGVNIETLKKVEIILPPIEIQNSISFDFVNALQRAEELYYQAEQVTKSAKSHFQEQLFGGMY